MSGDRNPSPASPLPPRRLLTWLGGGVAVLLAAVLATGCTHKGPAGPAAKKPEVTVTTPITDTVADYQDFTGRLSAVKTVDLRARVTGYVKSAHFKEGDPVKEGDVLFEIDPRSYDADLNQAEANLKLAQADSNLQQKNAQRAQRMYSDKAMAREDYETAFATAEKARATVKSMEAARDRAQLYVNYTKVVSPVNGRISYRYVDPGNLVNADNTVLTSIVTEDPLWAYFDVDERTFLDLGTATHTSTEGKRFADLNFPVLMRLANETEFTRAGVIDFVDNRVAAATGTVRMRGVFKNPDGLLKPGLFVRIRLPLGQPYESLLIPDEALLSDQGKSYVFVVDAQDKVKYQPVELGQALEGMRVIKSGLKKGERVITIGQQRVRAGMPVEVKVEPPPRAPESKLAKLLSRGQRTEDRGQKTEDRRQRTENKEQKRRDKGPVR
jgi:RND family efflux transporter MFP subunit